MNTNQNLVQVKRNRDGRMARYTPPTMVDSAQQQAKVVKITAKEFLLALRDASKVIPGMDRDQATQTRIMAEKAALVAYGATFDDKMTHAQILDAAKRKAQFAARM